MGLTHPLQPPQLFCGPLLVRRFLKAKLLVFLPLDQASYVLLVPVTTASTSTLPFPPVPLPRAPVCSGCQPSAPCQGLGPRCPPLSTAAPCSALSSGCSRREPRGADVRGCSAKTGAASLCSVILAAVPAHVSIPPKLLAFSEKFFRPISYLRHCHLGSKWLQ